ncbi:MAG: hypothetical protein AAGI52_01780 [Bacteroidota bacterium]
MHRLALVLAFLLPLALAACESDSEPSAAVGVSTLELGPELARAYEEGLGSLDNFRVFALGTSLYYISVGDSTRRTFQLARDPEAGMPNDPVAGNLFAFFPPNLDYIAGNLPNMTAGGEVEREGEQTLVFESAQPEHVGFGASRDATNQLARVYLDAETMDVRELFHRFEMDTIATPLAQRILYEDYREIADGVRVPFRVRQIQEGVRPTEDQVLVAGARFAMREQQAQQLPAGEREIALNDLEREKRFFREGINEVTLTIDSVLVNVAPPDTLSAPGLL